MFRVRVGVRIWVHMMVVKVEGHVTGAQDWGGV